MAERSRSLPRRAVLSAGLWSTVPLACSKRNELKPRRRVSLIMKSLANEFFLTMQESAKAHQRAHAGDYELVTSGTKDENDVARQVALVEQAILAQVDAIVIAPTNSKALVPACKKALDAKIVVVNIDNKLDAKVLAEKNFSVPFVGPNNRKGAKLAGDFLAKALRPGDSVAIIEGAAAAYNGVERKRGFEEAMKGAGMRLVSSRSANWETDQAEQATRAILLEHADLRGIMAANDSMAIGAANALQATGRANEILLVGFDNTSAARQLLKQGRLLATIDQHGDRLATFGIEYALEIISNNAIPADRETPVDLISS